MATYFAELDKNKQVVLRVIVASKDFIDSGVVGDPANWVETFMEGSTRKNYAGIGYKYDETRDAFIDKKPFESWILDESSVQWKSPKAMPLLAGKIISWDEATLDWVIKDSERIPEKNI